MMTICIAAAMAAASTYNRGPTDFRKDIMAIGPSTRDDTTTCQESRITNLQPSVRAWDKICSASVPVPPHTV